MSRPAASIQLNLSLWLSAAVLLAAAAAGILSFISMYREANDLQDQMLQQTAALINPAALPPRADNTDSDVRIHIQQLESSAPQHYALPARLSDGLQSNRFAHRLSTNKKFLCRKRYSKSAHRYNPTL